jgi:hypothetical protein
MTKINVRKPVNDNSCNAVVILNGTLTMTRLRHATGGCGHWNWAVSGRSAIGCRKEDVMIWVSTQGAGFGKREGADKLAEVLIAGGIYPNLSPNLPEGQPMHLTAMRSGRS